MAHAAPPAPEAAREPCHHALCDCDAADVRREGHAYCSATCADAESRKLETCPCRHGACRRGGKHVERPGKAEDKPDPPPVPPTVVL